MVDYRTDVEPKGYLEYLHWSAPRPLYAPSWFSYR
jgi:hypothetical protein